MTSMFTKPIIVTVPGAWYPASCFDLTASPFESHGCETIQLTSPTVGRTQPFLADVEASRDAIKTASDTGKVLLLFMHSYGGVLGCCAVEGLRNQDLQEGGVTALVFLHGLDARRGRIHPLEPHC